MTPHHCDSSPARPARARRRLRGGAAGAAARAGPGRPVADHRDAAAPRADPVRRRRRRTLADPAPFTAAGRRPSSSRCRRRRTTSGCASARASRLPDLDDPLRRQVGGVVLVAARLRRADGRSQPALPLSHRRSRSSSAACRSRSRCCRWSRARSTRWRCRPAARRASGSSCPSTGKDYGLKQNFWFDSRRDVIAATDGALDYLQKLHDEFDDWQLALAAYNWGEGNVARAIAKQPARPACRPTTRASRCRTRRATTCPSCRR